MTTTQPAALPELPEPDRTMWQHGNQIDHYTADQMRAYALATLQSAQPAEVSDEQKALAEQLKNIANGIRICGVSDHRFVGERLDKIASAILALRPQAVPMTDAVFDLICNAIDKADTITMQGDYMMDSDDCITVVRVMQALLSVRGITAKAKGGV